MRRGLLSWGKLEHVQPSLFLEQPLANPTTFANNMNLPVHRWYRYSAGFSAEWVASLLSSRDSDNFLVLDPFSGSGTTLITTDEHEVASIGVEAHPFVARVASAKLLWDIDADVFYSETCKILARAKHLYLEMHFELKGAPTLIQKTYTEEAFRKLESLRTAWLEQADERDESELSWLALTSILRICSHVGTAPWQYVLPKKLKAKVIDPFEAFTQQSRIMADDMRDLQSRVSRSQAIMLRGDARKLSGIEDSSVDLVVTSPPYANNYDYADATRLEMTFWREIERWGDLHQAARKHLVRSCTQHAAKEQLRLNDLLSDPHLQPILEELAPICRELEEERHLHGGKKQYHLMIAAYFCDMARVWQALGRVSKDNAEICFVLGDSAPYGIHVPLVTFHARLAQHVGFQSTTFEGTRDRNIKWKNRTHSVLLSEGHLWVKRSVQQRTPGASMSRVGSATHRLGQMIGNFFEEFFKDSLEKLSTQHGLYCDSKGGRSLVRGNRKKVTWQDSKGTPHDLDYVLERNASENTRGDPVAFIELAWRRYTKHSRNKAGEIEGALFHLKTTYSGAFLGAILAGEWSKGSLEQMKARGIKLLHIPFETVATTFDTKGIDLRYGEQSSSDVKWQIIEQWESLSQTDIEALQESFAEKISQKYRDFLFELEQSLIRRVSGVRIWYLYGQTEQYSNASEAISALKRQSEKANNLNLTKFEIQIRFSNSDRVEGEFHQREDAINFLKSYSI